MANDAYIPEFGDDRELQEQMYQEAEMKERKLQEQMYQEAMYELQVREHIEHLEYLEVLASGDCTQ